MTLGDVMARLGEAGVAEELLVTLGDVALMVGTRQAAEAAGVSVGEHVEEVVGRFVHAASPDQWVQLMTVMGRAADPGAACLATILRHTLREAADSP